MRLVENQHNTVHGRDDAQGFGRDCSHCCDRSGVLAKEACLRLLEDRRVFSNSAFFARMNGLPMV